jgi:hypothetical protein
VAGLLALASLSCLAAPAPAPARVTPAEPVVVAGQRFSILTGDDSPLTRRIADELHKRLNLVYASLQTSHASQRAPVVVAIGPAALKVALANPCRCALVAAFTSSQVWRRMTASYKAPRHMSMSAVFAEPSPIDQLELIALLYKKPVRTAALISSDNSHLAPMLQAAGVEIVTMRQGEDINKVLNRIARARVLLAVPDRVVYTTDNVRNILLSTYRHNQSVIGFSADMVRAGALATTYSDVEHINSQVADIVTDYLANGDLAPPQFPRYFNTIVHDGVARSLEVAVDAPVRNFNRQPEVRLPDLRVPDLRHNDVRQNDLRHNDLRPGDLRPGDLRPGDLRQNGLRADDARPGAMRYSDPRASDPRAGGMHPDERGHAPRATEKRP